MPEEIKLHLGCGNKYIEDYIHIDLADFPHVKYKNDICDLSMFQSNSVNLIYCCGTLEYFDDFEAEYALKEWKRVLKPNGILRLSVPDFAGIVAVYNKYKDIKHEGILGPLFGKISVNGKFMYQKTVYDFNSLKELLERVGFKNIQRYNAHDVMPKGYDDYSMAYVPFKDKKGIPISLNVEASK